MIILRKKVQLYRFSKIKLMEEDLGIKFVFTTIISVVALFSEKVLGINLTLFFCIIFGLFIEAVSHFQLCRIDKTKCQNKIIEKVLIKKVLILSILGLVNGARIGFIQMSNDLNMEFSTHIITEVFGIVMIITMTFIVFYQLQTILKNYSDMKIPLAVKLSKFLNIQIDGFENKVMKPIEWLQEEDKETIEEIKDEEIHEDIIPTPKKRKYVRKQQQ